MNANIGHSHPYMVQALKDQLDELPYAGPMFATEVRARISARLAAVLPGNRHYDANAMRYVAAWKQCWKDYVPRMMATRAVPDGVRWGSYPTFAGSVTSAAAVV